MPNTTHELTAEFFRNRPELATELLGGHLGYQLPESDGAEVISAEFNNIAPTEFLADVALKMTKGGEIAFAVIVESQQRPDNRKRFSWPVYVATLHSRLKCPVFLMVTCPNASVARWCEQPIVIGAEWFLTMTPVAMDLQQPPVVTHPAVAERLPELSVLSARAYGNTPGLEKPVLSAFVAGLAKVEPDRARLYYDFVASDLHGLGRTILEGQMTIANYEYRSDFARGYYEDGVNDGLARGEVEALLTVLGARGFDVSDDVRARIDACTDSEQLNAWIRRAVTIDKVEELFD